MTRTNINEELVVISTKNFKNSFTVGQKKQQTLYCATECVVVRAYGPSSTAKNVLFNALPLFYSQIFQFKNVFPFFIQF